MKVTPAKLRGFLADLSFKSKSILVFGPDPALISFRTSQLLQSLSDKGSFDIERHDSPPASLFPLIRDDQPSLFATEPTDKVILISNVKDRFLSALEEVLDAVNDRTLFILEGVGLPTSSKLVKFHDTEPGCFCTGVYEQSAHERKDLIAKYLKAHGLEAGGAELSLLNTVLAADPLLIAMEIEKLSLYVGEATPLTQAAIQTCIEPEVSENIDQLIHQVCLGDRAQLVKAYTLLKLEGEDDMKILRSLTNHFLRLLQVAARIRSGEAPDTALASLRPRLFFKTQDRFKAHLRKWSVEALYRALETLKEIEMQLKTTSDNLDSHISRGFLRLSTFTGR